MSDFHNSPDTPHEMTSDQHPETGNSEDVIAGAAIITIVILGAIHFVYTGGLLAFFHDVL
jgi:hypothetical protein